MQSCARCSGGLEHTQTLANDDSSTGIEKGKPALASTLHHGTGIGSLCEDKRGELGLVGRLVLSVMIVSFFSSSDSSSSEYKDEEYDMVKWSCVGVESRD